MSARDDGGPAFPFPSDGQTHGCCTGMTLRAYFAATALQGLLSQDEERWELMLEAMAAKTKKRGERRTVAEAVALAAVGYADGLLAELAK